MLPRSALRATAILALLAPLGCAGLEIPTILAGGAGGATPERTVLTSTTASLEEADFRVVRTDVTGESRGLKLLFLLTLDAASLTEAFSDFYQKARLETGTSQAIVNVVHERTERNFLLFSLPRITVRADVVEFESAPSGD